MHLLVADDLEDNAESLAMLLRMAPEVASVDVAFDGVQAVSAASRRPPDLAILDIEMPRLGGVDAGSALKLAARDRPPVLVAMSGNPDSVDSAKLSGVFEHVLTKPVAWTVLLAILASVAARTG